MERRSWTQVDPWRVRQRGKIDVRIDCDLGSFITTLDGDAGRFSCCSATLEVPLVNRLPAAFRPDAEFGFICYSYADERWYYFSDEGESRTISVYHR